MSEAVVITLPLVLTENEIKLVAIIRSLAPREKLVINADQDGKPDRYFVQRSHEIVLST